MARRGEGGREEAGIIMLLSGKIRRHGPGLGSWDCASLEGFQDMRCILTGYKEEKGNMREQAFDIKKNPMRFYNYFKGKRTGPFRNQSSHFFVEL